MSERREYQAAIGAVITSFNQLEVTMIDVIGCLLQAERRGEVVGWAIGFKEKVKVIEALLEYEDLADIKTGQLREGLRKAQKLSDEVRNQVAHAEMWVNPFDDSVNLRKPRFVKGRFEPRHLGFTAPQLWEKVQEIEEATHDIRSVIVYFDFRD